MMKPSQKSEICFQKLLVNIEQLSNNDKFLIEKLKKCYENTNKHFLWSNKFNQVVEKSIKQLSKNSISVISCISDFCNQLSKHKINIPLKHLIYKDNCEVNNETLDRLEDISNASNEMDTNSNVTNIPATNGINTENSIIKDNIAFSCNFSSNPLNKCITRSHSESNIRLSSSNIIYNDSNDNDTLVKQNTALTSLINSESFNSCIKQALNSQTEPLKNNSLPADNKKFNSTNQFFNKSNNVSSLKRKSTSNGIEPDAKKYCSILFQQQQLLDDNLTPQEKLDPVNLSHINSGSLIPDGLPSSGSSSNDIICLDDDDDDVMFISEIKNTKNCLNNSATINKVEDTQFLTTTVVKIVSVNEENSTTMKNKNSDFGSTLNNNSDDVVIVDDDDKVYSNLQIDPEKLSTIRKSFSNSPADSLPKNNKLFIRKINSVPQLSSNDANSGFNNHSDYFYLQKNGFAQINKNTSAADDSVVEIIDDIINGFINDPRSLHSLESKDSKNSTSDPNDDLIVYDLDKLKQLNGINIGKLLDTNMKPHPMLLVINKNINS